MSFSAVSALKINSTKKHTHIGLHVSFFNCLLTNLPIFPGLPLPPTDTNFKFCRLVVDPATTNKFPLLYNLYISLICNFYILNKTAYDASRINFLILSNFYAMLCNTHVQVLLNYEFCCLLLTFLGFLAIYINRQIGSSKVIRRHHNLQYIRIYT